MKRHRAGKRKKHSVGQSALKRRKAARAVTLGSRPANPKDICFDDRCFVKDGEREVWIVGGNLAPNYPQRFDDEEEARKYATKTGRLGSMHAVKEPIMRRISWT
jgi:hypothetical protein